MAEGFKDKGNTSFKNGDFASAVGFYTSAILADGKNPTYPLNRAASYLKLGKFQDAERDCSKVIALDPKSVKAYFRRGQARVGLENLKGAEVDFAKAVSLEPGNKTAQTELEKVKAQLSVKQDKTKTSIPLPPPVRRRVPIEIVDDEPLPVAEPVMSTSQEPKAKEKKPLIEELPSTPSPFKQAKEQREIRTSKIVGGGIFKRDGSHSNAIFEPRPVPMKESQQQEPKIPTQAAPIKKPTNIFEFHRQWGSFSTLDERWSILELIAPSDFPSLFKSSLEPPLLGTIITVLKEIVTLKPHLGDTVKQLLLGLGQIPRISTLVLFLNPAEKDDLRFLTQTLNQPLSWA